jgi:hypothetical protein
MANEPVSLKIDQGIIRPIIEAKINEGIVEMMGGKEKLIEDMLGAWMTRLVDTDGKTGEYNSKIPRFEYLITQMLNEALKKALNAYLAERQEQITAEFSKYFKSKAGSSALAKALQEGVCASLKSQWLTSISFRQLGER